MRILILYDSPFPGKGAASRRISNYRKGLVSLGTEVSILPIRLNGKSVFFSLLYPLYTLAHLLNLRTVADVYFVYGFGWVSKFVIIGYVRLKRSRVVLEINEKPYSIRDSGRRDRVLKYFAPINLYCLTHLVFPFVDGFVVISEALSEFVSRYSNRKASITKIPILVDYQYFQDGQSLPLQLPHPFMLHSATLNDSKDGIIAVFEAFSIVHEKYQIPLHFYLSTDLGFRKVTDAIESLVEKAELKPFVHYLDDPDDDTLLRYQRACDLVVINKTWTEQNKFNFSTRLGEYLALGKPIVTTPVGEVTGYLKDKKHCVYAVPDDPKDIAEKIFLVLSDRKLVGQLHVNAKQIAKTEFHYRENLEKLKWFFTLLSPGIKGTNSIAAL